MPINLSWHATCDGINHHMDSLAFNESNSSKRLRRADAVSNEKERQHMADNGVTRFIHDLRSPLTSVRSLSEILHDYPDLNSKKRQEFLDIIIREIENPDAREISSIATTCAR